MEKVIYKNTYLNINVINSDNDGEHELCNYNLVVSLKCFWKTEIV